MRKLKKEYVLKDETLKTGIYFQPDDTVVIHLTEAHFDFLLKEKAHFERALDVMRPSCRDHSLLFKRGRTRIAGQPFNPFVQSFSYGTWAWVINYLLLPFQFFKRGLKSTFRFFQERQDAR